MKKLLALSLIGSSLLIGSNLAKADTWDHWGIKSVSEEYNGSTHTFWKLYTINSSSGEATFRKNFCRYSSCQSSTGIPRLRDVSDIAYPENHVNKDSFILREYDDSGNVIYKKYTLNNNSISGETVTNANDYWFDDYSYTRIRGAAQLDSDGNYYSDFGGQMWVKESADGTVSWGKIGNTTAIYSLNENGVSQNGTNLISRSSDGVTSIGANSLKLQESNGLQKMWATNASGKSIPIDITNGSKLLINGRDVEQSINNVGALSAALTGLPTVPTETTLACGLGTGTHGGDFAFSGGCASKVNEKLSINYAASMTMPGQDYAGDFEDTFSARAGFVWKLGKSVKPSLISMKDNQKLTNELTDLKSENQNLNEKITKFETEKLELLARLERLEKVALGDLKSKDLAVYPLK